MIKIFLASTITISIILTNCLALIFSDNIYKNYFKNSEQLHYSLKIVSYLKFGKPIENGYFSNQALMHMEDVKSLVDIVKAVNTIALFTAFATILYLMRKKAFKDLKKSIFFAIISTTFPVLLIFLITIVNFNSAFLVFHKLFFTNNLWIFPPNDSLVTLFTPNFFIFFIRQLLTNTLITVVLLLLLTIKFIPTNAKNN